MILPFLTTPVEPSHRLNERRQAQKDECCMFSLVWEKKIAGVEGAVVSPKDWGERTRRSIRYEWVSGCAMEGKGVLNSVA